MVGSFKNGKMESKRKVSSRRKTKNIESQIRNLKRKQIEEKENKEESELK